ncbi:MAG TPA: IclR family transcriptional regulator [Burkholderiaceae bacterium]|nr:IclR family transcriptional regulator [Burkholderiaceae bacterium]
MEHVTEDARLSENRNIGRIIKILDALAPGSNVGLRLTDVVERTQMGKTTVHRLLAGLLANDLVEQDEDTGRFFIGMKMLAWAAAVKDRFGFVRLAEPALERINQSTHDTIYLVARVRDEVVCLDCREGSYPIKVLTLNIGDHRPLGIGAGSLAILAALPDEEVERVLRTQAAARAPFPFDELQLRQMIAETRRNGYSYNNVHLFRNMEQVPGMAAIGVPIRRRDGLPVAALHITSITSRMDPPRRGAIVAAMQEEARHLEEKLEPVLDEISRSPRPRAVRMI